MTLKTPPRRPAGPGGTDEETRPRRIAVFGSVAAERPAELPFTQAARAVLERVLAAIAAEVPRIARPILDRAVAEGTISRDERHALLSELTDPDRAPAEPAASSPGARGVLREALAAVRRASPQIAAPILREAVADERLTEAQERRILERLRSSPARARHVGAAAAGADA
jgi:hypothetical protein